MRVLRIVLRAFIVHVFIHPVLRVRVVRDGFVLECFCVAVPEFGSSACFPYAERKV